jgi:ribosomal protein S18 acetylase RimI-like enzyme
MEPPFNPAFDNAAFGTAFDRTGYRLRVGSTLDRALLVKVMQRAYQEMGASATAHLAHTVEQHLSPQTQLWWVEPHVENAPKPGLPGRSSLEPIGCLWLGKAIDQLSGQSQAQLFLLYVAPEHRRLGIGRALMQTAHHWAKAQGYLQIGLQVFSHNQAALRLYSQLGYQPTSLCMTYALL